MARGAASSVLSAVIVISALDGESERERERVELRRLELESKK